MALNKETTLSLLKEGKLLCETHYTRKVVYSILSMTVHHSTAYSLVSKGIVIEDKETSAKSTTWTRRFYKLKPEYSKAEEETARKIRSAGTGLLVQVSPSLIMINGLFVARSFDEFVKFCSKHRIEAKNFKNWPFTHRLDGSVAVNGKPVAI